jgi:3',5'-cyclic AMP phosphodiesterase CpdA
MTHRICWATDIHLDHLVEQVPLANGMYDGTRRYSESKVKTFCEKVLARSPDSVLITGDISVAPMIETHLGWLEKYIPDVPIYFVLGNHDFYGGSIVEVRERLQGYDGTKGRLIWLNTQGAVSLTKNTALVGHDGWYDGGYGDWFKSRLVMTEYHIVQEFRFKHLMVVFKTMQELAKQCADHIDKNVQAAAQTHRNVLFATHVPAFRNNSRAPDRRLSDSDWLPNMSSKKAGDALYRAASAFPDTKFTCLSGHTHTKWSEEYLPNLKELTGASKYGHPARSIEILEIE